MIGAGLAVAVLAFDRLIARLICVEGQPARPASAAGIASTVSAAYGLIWEGGQIVLAAADPLDSVVDWAAVTFGAVMALALWTRAIRPLVAAVTTLCGLLVIGVRRRR